MQPELKRPSSAPAGNYLPNSAPINPQAQNEPPRYSIIELANIDVDDLKIPDLKENEADQKSSRPKLMSRNGILLGPCCPGGKRRLVTWPCCGTLCFLILVIIFLMTMLIFYLVAPAILKRQMTANVNKPHYTLNNFTSNSFGLRLQKIQRASTPFPITIEGFDLLYQYQGQTLAKYRYPELQIPAGVGSAIPVDHYDTVEVVNPKLLSEVGHMVLHHFSAKEEGSMVVGGVAQVTAESLGLMTWHFQINKDITLSFNNETSTTNSSTTSESSGSKLNLKNLLNITNWSYQFPMGIVVDVAVNNPLPVAVAQLGDIHCDLSIDGGLVSSAVVQNFTLENGQSAFHLTFEVDSVWDVVKTGFQSLSPDRVFQLQLHNIHIVLPDGSEPAWINDCFTGIVFEFPVNVGKLLGRNGNSTP